VDLVSGAEYWENMTVAIPPVSADYKLGRVTLRLPRTALGHPFRFFYRSTDQAMLTVIKPAERFLPADTFGGIVPPPAPTYATDVVGTASSPIYTVLNFLSGQDVTGQQISTSAGMMVGVDYNYGDAAHPQQIVGELHTIPLTLTTINNNPGFFITLNNPGVLDVIAVRAASLKVRAWWRTEGGRLQMADIDTILSPLRAPS